MSILLRGKKSLSQLARAILRSFGPNASSYPFSTLQGAYQTSSEWPAAVAVAVNDPVGLELDAMGTRTDLIVSQDLTTWTSGGGFNNWAQSTATATTITAIGAYGSRYIRYACAPGNLVQFSALVVAGTMPGMVSIVFGDSGLGYLQEYGVTPIASGAIAVGGVAPATTAYVEIVVRAVDAGGTVGFTGLSALKVTGNHATQTTAINRPTLQQDGGGRWYASFNGTNQSMALASVPFQMADDFAETVCFIPTGNGAVLDLSGNPVGQQVGGISVSGGNLIASFQNDAATHVDLAGGAVTFGVPMVATVWQRSGVRAIRVNGAQVGGTNSTVFGATTVTLSKIGVNTWNGNFFPGSIYSLDVIKGTTVDAQLLTIEKAAAQRAGLVI